MTAIEANERGPPGGDVRVNGSMKAVSQTDGTDLDPAGRLTAGTDLDPGGRLTAGTDGGGRTWASLDLVLPNRAQS